MSANFYTSKDINLKFRAYIIVSHAHVGRKRNATEDRKSHGKSWRSDARDIVSISGMSIIVTRGEIQCKSNDAHIPWFGMIIKPNSEKGVHFTGKAIWVHGSFCITAAGLRVKFFI